MLVKKAFNLTSEIFHPKKPNTLSMANIIKLVTPTILMLSIYT